MLDAIRAEIEQRAVMQAAQKQVIQRLAGMCRSQFGYSLCFYDDAPIHEQVGEVVLGKLVETGGHLQFGCGHNVEAQRPTASSQLTLVKTLVEISAKFIVDIKCQSRDAVVNLLKLRLSRDSNRNGSSDRHRVRHPIGGWQNDESQNDL